MKATPVRYAVTYATTRKRISSVSAVAELIILVQILLMAMNQRLKLTSLKEISGSDLLPT